MRAMRACKGKQVLSEQSEIVLPKSCAEKAAGKRDGWWITWGTARMERQKY